MKNTRSKYIVKLKKIKTFPFFFCFTILVYLSGVGLDNRTAILDERVILFYFYFILLTQDVIWTSIQRYLNNKVIKFELYLFD